MERLPKESVIELLVEILFSKRMSGFEIGTTEFRGVGTSVMVTNVVGGGVTVTVDMKIMASLSKGKTGDGTMGLIGLGENVMVTVAVIEVGKSVTAVVILEHMPNCEGGPRKIELVGFKVSPARFVEVRDEPATQLLVTKACKWTG